MSRSVSRNANLEIANSIRKAGFKNLLDSQPEMAKRFRQLIVEEASNIKAAHRKLQFEFTGPNDHVPSRIALQAYVKRHINKVYEVAPYTPDYTKMLRKYDPVVKAYQHAKEAENRYKRAVAANLGATTTDRLFNTMMKANETLHRIQVQQGIANSVGADNALATGNTNINVGVQVNSGVPTPVDPEREAIIARFKRMQANEERVTSGSSSVPSNGSAGSDTV